MSNSLIQYAYVSGEVAPKLYGRTDLEKYDLGLAKAHNWFVDYRGGISTRPGTRYLEWQQSPQEPIKWFTFEFSPNVANTATIIFGKNYIRFLQEGLYVLEAPKTLSAVTAANPAVFTSNAHGYNNFDLVKLVDLIGPSALANRTFEVTNVTTNTFRLRDQFGVPVSALGLPAFVSGKVAKVYSIASPYSTADLRELRAEQNRDLLRLTHYKYITYDLKRFDTASWGIFPTEFNAQIQAPSGLAGAGSTSGSAGVAFCVTAVDFAGNESMASEIVLLTGIVNYTATAGSALISWAPVPGTKYYNVYRSTVFADGALISRAVQFGFLGRTYGAYFVDTNIIPNFTIAPPQYNNPFANGAIQWIDVAFGGSGHTQATTIVITDGTGAGATAFPVVNPSGEILGVVVTRGGISYSASPTVSTAGPGSGALFTTKVGSTGRNYPGVSTIFQQRQVYAGTLDNPLTLWGSKPRRFNNFDNSAVIIDSDSYEFEIDARQVSTIQHLRPMRGGLLIMNQVGIWQLTGGNQLAVTPTNALAEPQSYTGISDLPPIQIETDILYIEAKGFTARLLAYNDLAKLYAGTDISILSSHLFGKGKEPVSWTYASDPFKLVHAIREDGLRLVGAIVKDQNVFSWTPTSTKGYYRQAITLRENRNDRVYLDVERTINGKLVRYVELEAQRDFDKIEDAWCLDCALDLPVTYPAGTLQAAAASGLGVAFTSDSAVFAMGDVGKIIFGGGGKMKVKTYVSPTQITCDIIRPITSLFPETTDPRLLLADEWTMDAAVSTISGLWHLEGQTVSILADGNVMPPRTVVNGTITLDFPSVRAIIGLAYTCTARTLPTTASGGIIEDQRKRIVGAATRVHESRGLWMGAKLDTLYESKDRSTENYGQPILPRSDMIYTAVEPEWDFNGQIYYQVTDPLPVTVLGHVLSLEIGDDKE